MGAVESTSVLGSHQELLDRFIGPNSIPLSDPFWEDLLSFSYPLPKLKPADLDALTREAWSTLVQHNLQTQHIGKLMAHLRRALGEAPRQQSLPLRAINAVLFTRLFVKHMVEFYSSREIWDHILLYVHDDEAGTADLAPGEQSMAVPTVQSLLQIIADCDVNAPTYILHLEVVNLLLVMLSTQLHGKITSHAHIFFDAVMGQHELAGPVVRKLLLAYMARLPVPARAPHYAVPGGGAELGVLRKVGSAAAAVLLLPYYTYTYLLSSAAAGGVGRGNCPLAENSLLLLLLLVHYGKEVPAPHGGLGGGGGGDEGEAPSALSEPGRPEYEPNAYRTALGGARDASFDVAGPDDENGAAPNVHIPFAAVYDTLGACLLDDRSTLLLYSLVHGNPAFLEYLLVRADLDTILLPLLEMLYTAPQRTANQIYMLLIVLLILSQDSSFNANVHKLLLPGVPWYKERLLPRISLGSLMVVILIRTIKYNLSKLRDVYLHTNCLAALANMAPHAHQLNAYASQRLISLFLMLARKYTRLSELSATLAKGPPAPGEAAAVPDTAGGAPSGDVPTELHIYTDFLRIVLEIINAILTYALPRNPEVVYALLHRQELFVPFRHHPRFYELLENIFTVIDFFNARIDGCVKEGEWSVERVLQLVIANTRAWRGEGMKMFTELRFTYEEELHPEEFFVPYVWSLVVAHSGIPWNPDSISLFPAKPTVELDEVFDADAFDTNSEYLPTPREDV